MTQTSRLTVVKKRDTNKRKLGGTINVIRNEDKGKDNKTHSGLFLEIYNNENTDVLLNHPIENIHCSGGKENPNQIDGFVIRKIFLLPDEINILPKVQFPVCKELLNRIDESKFTGNELVAVNKVLQKVNKSAKEIFTGLIEDCIKYINKEKNIENMVFKIIIPNNTKDSFNFYKSYFIPISGLNKDNMTIFLYVTEIDKLHNYDINKIKDIVMFDICKY
jgi:hypothetical protein